MNDSHAEEFQSDQDNVYVIGGIVKKLEMLNLTLHMIQIIKYLTVEEKLDLICSTCT